MNIDIPISLSHALSWMLISTDQNAHELNWDGTLNMANIKPT